MDGIALVVGYLTLGIGGIAVLGFASWVAVEAVLRWAGLSKALYQIHREYLELEREKRRPKA